MALKACIAKKTRRHDFPNKETHKVLIHDLTKLLGYTSLRQLQQEREKGPDLAAPWSVVNDWDEESRYKSHGRKKAKGMLDAVAEGGVFACIKKYW